MTKKKLTGLEVNEDGQTTLYELCSRVYMTSESGTQEVKDLIDSYPEKMREAIVNKKVETPARVKRFDNNPRFRLRGYDIDDSPLHVAVRNEAPFVTEKLLQSGANPNAVNGEGFTPLDEAIQYKNFKIAELLIKYGAKVNVADRNMDTPLMLAQDVMQEDPSNKDVKKIINLIISINRKEELSKKFTNFKQQAANLGKTLLSFGSSYSSKAPKSVDSSLTSKKSSDSISSNASDTDETISRISPLTVDSETSETSRRMRKAIEPMLNPGAATQNAVNRPNSSTTVVESYQSASSISTDGQTRSGNGRGRESSAQVNLEILKPVPMKNDELYTKNAPITPNSKKLNKLER